MSPSASHPNSPGRSFDELPAALITSKLAGPEDIRGCSDAEVSQVQRLAPFPLPDDYVSFLRTIGRGSGRLFQCEGMLFPEMLEGPLEVAEYLRADPRQSLSLEDRFFFGEHQGYIVYFFQKEDSAVYTYQEGHPESPAQLLAPSFTQWAWNFCDALLRYRVRHKEMRKERQRKREPMGLPREEYHEW